MGLVHGMMECADMKSGRILVVSDEMGRGNQRQIAGISDCAKRRGWAVDVVEARHFGKNPDFTKWIDIWHPDGIVLDRVYANQALACRAARRIPMAIWGSNFQGKLSRRCVTVENDPAAIAEAAGRELAQTDYPRFAFVNALGGMKWSRDREEAFSSFATSIGRPVAVFKPTGVAVSNAARFSEALSRFLRGLETPCAVFAANDVTSALVASLCGTLELSIPDDIALVGVDDNAEYCERSALTLSSVRIDMEGGGAMAAAAVIDMAESGGTAGRSGGKSVRYGVECVVRRASTRALRIRSGIVTRALEWIRQNACQPIVAADVVKALGCSRRLADLRFRQATGHTILEEIHARRIEAAKALLKRSSIPIEEIPEKCGYGRNPYLGIIFKRATGMSMRQWRMAQRRQKKSRH